MANGLARTGWERIFKGPAQNADLSDTRRLYILFLMGLVTALAVMDRNILNVLLTPIKHEIGASDTAMGLLTGTAFAVFYATAAIPISRLVDTWNRRNLLAISLAVWSGATALCGLASTYFHLLLGRIGVAAGEASASPAVTSIIADIYPPQRRATALGVILMGTGVGVLAGSYLGGFVAEAYGWRAAFMVVGIPGVLIALLLWQTTPEPVRGALEGGVKDDPDSATLGATLRYVSRTPTFGFILSGKSMVQIGSQASQIWIPAFLVRIHGMSLTEVGLWFGLAIAGGTILAAIFAGIMSDRLAKSDPKWYLYFCIGSQSLAAPAVVLLTLTGTPALAIMMIFVHAFVSSCNTTPSLAAGLLVVRPRMRGFAVASMNFVINLVGAGLGGLLIGVLNDLLAPRFGIEAIRYSLLLSPAAALIGAGFYFLGSRTIRRDSAKALQVAASA